MSNDKKKTPTYTCPNEMTDTTWWFDDGMGTVEYESWEPRRCSCGSWAIYGEDCSIEFHSEWCDLIRKD